MLQTNAQGIFKILGAFKRGGGGVYFMSEKMTKT